MRLLCFAVLGLCVLSALAAPLQSRASLNEAREAVNEAMLLATEALQTGNASAGVVGRLESVLDLVTTMLNQVNNDTAVTVQYQKELHAHEQEEIGVLTGQVQSIELDLEALTVVADVLTHQRTSAQNIIDAVGPDLTEAEMELQVFDQTCLGRVPTIELRINRTKADLDLLAKLEEKLEKLATNTSLTSEDVEHILADISETLHSHVPSASAALKRGLQEQSLIQLGEGPEGSLSDADLQRLQSLLNRLVSELRVVLDRDTVTVNGIRSNCTAQEQELRSRVSSAQHQIMSNAQIIHNRTEELRAISQQIGAVQANLTSVKAKRSELVAWSDKRSRTAMVFVRAKQNVALILQQMKSIVRKYIEQIQELIQNTLPAVNLSGRHHTVSEDYSALQPPQPKPHVALASLFAEEEEVDD